MPSGGQAGRSQKEDREAMLESKGREGSPDGRYDSGGSGISGLEFKQTLPTMKDSDTDFDLH